MRTLLVFALFSAIAALGFALRFDSVSYICPTVTQPDGTRNLSYSCPKVGNTRLTCMCQYDFEQLNSLGGHYIAYKFPLWKDALVTQSNTWTMQYDQINDGFPGGSGAEFADKVYDTAQKYADANQIGIPQYFLLNEISVSRWSQNRPNYRRYIIDMAAELRNKGLIPIVFAPIMFPAKNSSKDWIALSKVAYVAIEAYLSTKQILLHGKTRSERKAYMKSVYLKSLNAYKAVGVPKNRIALFEHYGNTDGSKGAFGRYNASEKNWIQIIQLRNELFKELKVWSVGSYGWFGNQMKIDNAQRQRIYAAYNAGWRQ